jgi:DNA-binding IscR family transcriptional regulator
MGEIVRALEGQIAPMICATEGAMPVICDRLEGCSTKVLWGRVRDAISNALDSMTLADLVEANRPLGGAGQFVTLTPRARRNERQFS